MTEQENRIEEMANDIPEKINVMFSQKTYILLSEYLRKNISIAIVKKGYRKADEVRKETAKEIISILNCEKGLRPNVVTDYWDRIDNVIKFIKKEFCAEVEE